MLTYALLPFVVAAAGAQAAPASEVLLQAGFEQGDAGWRRTGDAQFAVDAAQAHAGKQSLRITIPAGTEPHWQQWQREIPNVTPGDAFHGSVWIRTQGVEDGTGAYFVLEYLDADGNRCGIDHPRLSLATGKDAWEKLEIFGHAAEGAQTLRVGLILHSHGTAWFDDVEVVRTERAEPFPDLGDAERRAVVHTGQVIQPHFGGAGYHAFHHDHDIPQEMFDQVVGKRWREVDPSFVRMNHEWNWTPEHFDHVAEQMRFMQDVTGTEIYLTTWNPQEAKTPAEYAAYAKLIVGQLETLIRKKGIHNLHFYCMSNELSLSGWGKMAGDLPRFREYHRALFDELKARKLDVKLLATDASPISYWNTIEWAAKNMDDITGIYGGHHYINDRTLEDERFYPWFLAQVQREVGIAHAKGKEFILGEFGSKQDGRVIDGVRMDACVYWGTPKEPLVPIQVCEAAIAAMNAGAYAVGYWTFMDFPDNPASHYANKWGLFKWSGNDFSTRPIYYAYGLLTKLFRGPAAVYTVTSSDPRLRIAAVQHAGKGTWSIAVVNRNKRPVRLALSLEGKPLSAAFRKYVYDPAAPPANPFGDLQAPAGKVAMAAGRLSDTLAPGTFTIYTTAYDDQPPAAVRGLRVETAPNGKRVLTWEASAEPDFCYYRVYRGAGRPPLDVAHQIASTIAPHYTDAAPPAGATYRVVAVDQSGNPSE